MRTSVEISDALLERARAVMAEQGVTLRALVEEGLRRVLDEPRRAEPFALRDARFDGTLGFVPGRDESAVSDAIREMNEGPWRP